MRRRVKLPFFTHRPFESKHRGLRRSVERTACRSPRGYRKDSEIAIQSAIQQGDGNELGRLQPTPPLPPASAGGPQAHLSHIPAGFSRRNLPWALEYIAHQKEHHARSSVVERLEQADADD